MSKEIIVVDYAVSDPIALGQYTEFNATLLTNFIQDFNLLWNKQQECIERGILHICKDSLTSFQKPALEYVKAMNARVVTVVQDWGQAIDKIDEVVQSGVALPFDFIMTAHTQVEKDEMSGRVKEGLLIYGKALPSVLLAKFDDIFLSLAQRSPSGMSYSWGTNRSGPLQVWMPKGMESGSPPAQMWPYEGVPVGTRNFTNLPPRIAQNFEKLYGEMLFNGKNRGVNVLLVGESKSGKTKSFETLPNGVLDFSFDIGGWHALARKRDEKRELGKGEESVWLTEAGRPLTVVRNFKVWLESNDRALL